MSRLFEALSGLKAEHRSADGTLPLAATMPPLVLPSPKPAEPKLDFHTLKVVPVTQEDYAAEQTEPAEVIEEPKEAIEEPVAAVETPTVRTHAVAESRLVALTDPNSLGAEKFRALATRFDHLRAQRELRSFQVSSSVIDEGKTLVAGNTAVTLAKYSGTKTLLVEGDLHRPTLAQLFGLRHLAGLSQWWSGHDELLGNFIHRLDQMPLWFLPAGGSVDRPSDLLRSARFQRAFSKLSMEFEWIVVDSTPMLPIVDVNLWSRLVDGTLLVVREGVTPIKALKNGLRALDRPNLIGVVVNEATESGRTGYDGYYTDSANGHSKPAPKQQ